jgi:trimeric autotransporter adhesin
MVVMRVAIKNGKELKGMNINWLSRHAARVVASVLVMGIGCLLASCDEGGGAPGLQSIELTPPNAQAAAGTALQLHATGIYSDGTHQDVTGQVIWGTTDGTIATFAVGSGGQLSALVAGTVTIAATLHDRVGTTGFTVTPAFLVSIGVTPAAFTGGIGSSVQLTATGTFSDGSTQDLTTQVLWSSGDATIALLSSTAGSSGSFIMAGVGRTTITASSGSISSSTTLTVTGSPLTSIQVTPFNISLPEGVSRQLTATGILADNLTEDLTSQVTWSSSQPNFVTVSNATGSAGLVVGVALGTSIITATSATGIVASSPVTVTAAILTSIQITPGNATIANGLARQLAATGTYTDGSTQDLTSQVTWASSNTAAATVSNASGSNGLASSAGVGATTVSATLGTVSGSTAFSVTAATLVSIQVTPNSPGIGNGLTEQFVAIGTYTDNSQQYVTSRVTWASSNTAAATISNAAGSNGLATAAGQGTSTVSASSGSVSASTVLTVRALSHVYIANLFNVYVCSINLTDGSLTGCAVTGSGFQGPFGIALTGDRAYVANSYVVSGPSISVCDVATDGTLTGCALTAANVSTPGAMAINGATLYVADGYNGGVAYCTILSDGSLPNCGLTATSFDAFGMVAGFGAIYASDNSGFVDVCAVDTDGSLSACATTGNRVSATGGLSQTGNLVYAVNNAVPDVDICPINPDGTLGNCTASVLPTGANPIDVLVVGSHAYVADEAGLIYLCAVSPADGSLSNCTVSNGGGSFLQPSQIAIY